MVPSPRLVSIFFGGGTPSLWQPKSLGRVLRAIQETFTGDDVEITVECNPSSLDYERARALHDVGVNRLSVGVQSLDADRLAFLGRRHSADGALAALRAAIAASLPRVSSDLLYGVSGQTPARAVAEVSALADVGITHISAYNLTIEPNTQFGALARRGRLPLASDSAMVDSFFAVHEALAARSFGHYEISNYARAGDECRHNLGYWHGVPYLGLGCGAYGTVPWQGHQLRYRNQPEPRRYVAAVRELPAQGANLFTVNDPLSTLREELEPATQLRERIMLGLRLVDGFNLAEAAAAIGAEAWPVARKRAAERLIQRGRLVREEDRLRVPLAAWALVDGTAAELF